jgi:hypothetical protein
MQGDLAGAAAQFGEVAAEAETAHDVNNMAASLAGRSVVLAWQGDTGAARAAANAAIEAGSELGAAFAVLGYAGLVSAALAAGDVEAALDATEAWQHLTALAAAVQRALNARAALAGGDLIGARRGADDAVATTIGWWQTSALTTRARVAIAQGELDQAERDAHDALANAAGMQAYLEISDILECLAALAGEAGSHREAARLCGAAESIRHRMGVVRFEVWDAGYQASVAALRDALGEKDFESAWAEGAALSIEEAIAYAHAAAANANDPPAAGPRSPPPNVTWCDWSAKDWPTTTSPHGSSSHRAPCKPTSPTSTPNSDSPPAYSSPKKQPATPNPWALRPSVRTRRYARSRVVFTRLR